MIDTLTRIKKIILSFGDIIILYFSLYLTLLIRYREAVSPERWQLHFLPFTLIFALWLIIFYINNLYDLNIARNNTLFYATLIKSIVWCAALAIGFFYIFDVVIEPKTNLFINIITFSILFALWRQSFNRIANIQKLKNNVLIIGLNQTTLDLAVEINQKPQLGFQVMAIYNPEQKLFTNNLKTDSLENCEIINTNTPLKDLIKFKNISTIITNINLNQNQTVLNQLHSSLDLKITVFDLPGFLEKFTGKIPVNSIGQIWFLENIQEGNKSFYEIFKRLFDILLSIILLLISLPFVPLIYLLVKLNTPGPFIFKQIRVGKNSKNFLAMKIRTMHKNAEINGPQWATKNDLRVTRSGKILRKTRIDEIPQLFNILRGEMSFIGPRPERPEFVKNLNAKIPFYNERHLVKPGLTGWAQINFPYGASEADALEKLQYDLYYIKNRSIMLDIAILLKTIKTVLTGAGQ